MRAQLQAQSGGGDIPVWEADLAAFDLQARDSVVVCAVSTLFMLPDRAAQIACVGCAPPPRARWCRRRRPSCPTPVATIPIDAASSSATSTTLSLHVVISKHDPTSQTVAITHVRADNDGLRRYVVILHYAWPSELDRPPKPDSTSPSAQADGTTGPTSPQPPTTSAVYQTDSIRNA